MSLGEGIMVGGGVWVRDATRPNCDPIESWDGLASGNRGDKVGQTVQTGGHETGGQVLTGAGWGDSAAC